MTTHRRGDHEMQVPPRSRSQKGTLELVKGANPVLVMGLEKGEFEGGTGNIRLLEGDGLEEESERTLRVSN